MELALRSGSGKVVDDLSVLLQRLDVGTADMVTEESERAAAEYTLSRVDGEAVSITTLLDEIKVLYMFLRSAAGD